MLFCSSGVLGIRQGRARRRLGFSAPPFMNETTRQRDCLSCLDRTSKLRGSLGNPLARAAQRERESAANLKNSTAAMEATEEVREGASQLRPVEAKAGEAQEEAGAAPVLASVDAPAAGSADGAPSVAEADLAVAAEGAPAGPDRPAAKGAASDSPVTLPLSNVLKCVKASTPMLQTREAKDLFSRSAAIFTVFLSSSCVGKRGRGV